MTSSEQGLLSLASELESIANRLRTHAGESNGEPALTDLGHQADSGDVGAQAAISHKAQELWIDPGPFTTWLEVARAIDERMKNPPTNQPIEPLPEINGEPATLTDRVKAACLEPRTAADVAQELNEPIRKVRGVLNSAKLAGEFVAAKEPGKPKVYHWVGP